MSKQFTETPLAIEKFRDRWDINNDPEIAKKLLEVLQESPHIAFEDKAIFFVELLPSPFSHPNALIDNTRWIVVRILFELVHDRPDLFPGGFKALEPLPHPSLSSERQRDDMLRATCMAVLHELGIIPHEFTKGWQNKITKFLHRILESDSEGQDVIVRQSLLPQALAHHGLFEELANPHYKIHWSVAVDFLLYALSRRTCFAGDAAYLLAPERKKIITEILWHFILTAYKNPDTEDKTWYHKLSVLERLLAREGYLDLLEVKEEPSPTP